MFKGLKNRWAEARADVLRKEVEDIIARAQSLDEEVNFYISQHLINALESVERNCGPLKNMSNDGKKTIAKDLSDLAKKSFDLDMGKGYGIFLCSAHIESQVLPGDNARYVQSATQELINIAQTINDQVQT